jgi:monothiol glutaredoxin
MEEIIKNKIQGLIDSSKVFLFMKGIPDMPQCGFSSRVVGILREVGVEFASFDVLSDDSIREGIKEFSNWPTIPQLYINGKFIGGSDICSQMMENGELKKLLE